MTYSEICTILFLKKKSNSKSNEHSKFKIKPNMLFKNTKLTTIKLLSPQNHLSNIIGCCSTFCWHCIPTNRSNQKL